MLLWIYGQSIIAGCKSGGGRMLMVDSGIPMAIGLVWCDGVWIQVYSIKVQP